MSFARYALVVSAIAFGSLALVWALLRDRLEPAAWRAALVGAALAAGNTIAAYGLVLWSGPRSPNVFLGVVLGGMVGRMALMLGAVVAAILGLGLPRLPLVVSLLSYFVLFLVLELSVLQRRTSAPGGAA